MLEKVLAKSNPPESLTEHTLALYKAWSKLRDRYYKTIPNEEFWYYSLITIFFHDFGKINCLSDILCVRLSCIPKSTAKSRDLSLTNGRKV